jgi:hypothetical protein
MNGWQKSSWAKVIASGLFIATLTSCNSDEPAANVGTPAPGNVGNAADTAPIASGINTSSTAPSSSPGSSTAPSTEASKSSTTKETTTKEQASTPKKSVDDSKLIKPSIAADKPLPEADVTAKPAPVKVEEQGGLSKSQIDTMKTTLEEAKKLADGGKLKEAVDKYNEFAGGSWETASQDPKAKGNSKIDAIATAVKAADEAAKGTDATKLAKAIADVSAAVAKAK